MDGRAVVRHEPLSEPSKLKSIRNPLFGGLMAWAARLRFPQLFLLTVVLFFVDLLIPDLIPLADELLLGLAAILLGSLRKRTPEPPQTEESNGDSVIDVS